MNIQHVQVIDEHEFSELVTATYGRPYCLQQHGDWGEAMASGTAVHVEVPNTETPDNHEQNFQTWLNTPIAAHHYILWQNTFYPSVHNVVNDLHQRGLLDAGEYTISVGW